MLFSEIPFFVFFLTYLTLHLLLPARWRLYLVIGGSTVFYAWWRVEDVWLPYLLTLIGWAGAIWIDLAADARARKRRLVIAVFALFTPLLVVKYAFFLLTNIVAILPGGFVTPDEMTSFRFALPLGISFMTFTITAYVVDTYRSQYPVEKKLQKLLAYVLFFPHLIAGPILRPNELLPQFSHWTRAIDARFTLGVCLFAIGLTKKLVFADIIAGVVDHVYASTAQQLSAWEYLLAIHGFSVQIYCDFSGYTDMAIGTACILGIRLPINFRRPYAAHSIVDFWRRWHITLSSWLRDYLYIPLGGNRNGEGRRLLNLMTTMVLGGLWHGAAWTFVIWGALHGTALVGVHLLRARLARWNIVVPAWLGILGTFYFVTFAWVYFRAPDIGTAHRVLQGPFTASWDGFRTFAATYAFELILVFIFLVTHRYDAHSRVRMAVRTWNKGILWPVVVAMFALAITVSQGSSAKFIYFEF
ncbi:MAG TPA: MBOAT family O-acyltransferase [Bradyrhizobium sp.]|uniref:MBOAT family O-acyltransferase n=1 Tax=Bradyrhizobium sp. TaxID=376 RepID=UPI002B60B133|nr:MBOAT family O-acyltransferase [Bradyrhizobium sp.]HTB04954.1 MBOAT family O-acyltransferase [Bradyrhizobium sp.]